MFAGVLHQEGLLGGGRSGRGRGKGEGGFRGTARIQPLLLSFWSDFEEHND